MPGPSSHPAPLTASVTSVHSGVMRRRLVHLLPLVLAVSLCACKQGEGRIPDKSGDVPQRLVDLGRDLEGVVAGDKQAVTDLTDDLLVFTEEPEGMNAIRAMSATVTPMLVKRSMNGDTLARLANLLWLTVAARDFSERQIDTLKDEMRDLLLSIGITQQDANLAAGWVGNVQKAVTLRSRRWYERY